MQSNSIGSAYSYTPYGSYDDSDTESDSSSEYSTTDESDFEEEEPFQNFVNIPQQQHQSPPTNGGLGFIPPDPAVIYRISPSVVNTDTEHVIESFTDTYAGLDLSGVKLEEAVESRYNPTKFAVESKDSTATVMFSSTDRDTAAYPQPTLLQLHLPRTYKNVVSLQITQLKLLSSFLYFRDAKYNTEFTVFEQGRTDSVTLSDNKITIKIREGSYNINSLITELHQQMNKTPVFFYFPNGYDDFARIFPTSGDLSIGFNQPGDYYYNSLTDTFIQSPSMTYIVTRYFQSQYAGLFTYTPNQTLNAYYYPVLKEVFLDPAAIINIDVTTISGMTVADIYKHIVFEFEGLDDVVTYTLIKANQEYLDYYRTQNTFAHSLVNSYSWTYDTFNNRITVASTSLNTSIVRYINNITTQYTNDILTTLSGGSSMKLSDYQAMIVQRNQDAAVLTDMYNHLQTALATNFAVNFGSYTMKQLADISLNYTIYIQNAQDVSGVFKQYSLDYFKQKETGQVKIPPDFSARPTPPRPKWKLDTLADATVDFTNINMGIRNNPYDFTMSNQIITDTYAIDPTTYTINTGNLTQTVNIVADIQPTKYTVFQFTSPVRQTIQIETLSRPLFYRYPEYNYNFGGSIPYFYNKTLSYVDNSAADISDISLNTIPIIRDGNGVPSQNILTAIQLSTTRTNTVEYYTFITPDISGAPTDSSGVLYTAKLTINAANTVFGSDVTAYIYHDRAAFMADAAVERTENILHYKYTATAAATSNTLEIPIRLHTLDQYYVIFRSISETIPDIPYSISLQINTLQLRPQYLMVNFEGDPIQDLSFSFQNPYEYLAHYANASQINYYIARTYDPAFIRLPLAATADSSVTPDDQLFSLTFPPGLPPIGYDSSGVSNDPTDYIFIPGDPYGDFDPSRTIGLFYDPLTTYIYQLPQNKLLAPDNQNRIPYTYKGPPVKREYKIVHYHDTHFMTSTIPLDGDLTQKLLHRPALRTVYDISAADLTATYKYTADSNFTGKRTLQLGQGICGISFTPTEGWWDMAGFTFKSADYTVTSPNNNIAYIGIYPFRAISQKNADTISLADSIAVLEYSGQSTYSPSSNVWDKNWGTYYTFKLTPQYPHNRPDIVADGFAGFTQYPQKNSIKSEEDLYTAIPFDAAGRVTTFHMLAGSLIPRPDINSIDISTNTTGAAIVIPTAASGTIVWQSQYKDSLPIGTQALNYIDTVQIFKDSLAFSEYNPGKYIGDVQWSLRFVGFNGGVTNSYYYLTGTPIIPYRGDVYCVPGTGQSYYNNQFDLTAAIPIGHIAITWTANTHQGHLLTASSSSNLHIYKFNPLEKYITNLTGDISFTQSYISVTDITKVSLTVTNTSGIMIIGPSMGSSGTTVLFHKNGTTTRKDFFLASGERFIEAYVHCDESTEFHVLVAADNTYPIGTQFIYDISQSNADTYNKTLISPLFGKGIYSLRTDSTGAPYFLSTQFTNRYASITGRDIVTGQSPYKYVARFEVNEQSLNIPLEQGNIYWHIGTNNSIFFQKHIGSLFDDKPWIIYGNTQLGEDKKRGIYSAWQIFYPVIKITLNKRANIYNSITNRIDINQPKTGAVVPENYRTCAFFYKDLSSLLTDISGPSGWKWGQETNYISADRSFNGYEFNSYINNINVTPTDVSHSYYLAIRGYSPSESFQTLVRWRAPNRYDFGQVTLMTISNEIIDSSNNPSKYNPTYTQLLASFNKYFADIYNKQFGANQISNFAGITNTTSTFADFYNIFMIRYKSYNTKNKLIEKFNTTLSKNVSTTLSGYFGTILPSSYFKRTNIGTAIPFNLLFKSYISPQIPTNAETEWGIGWNLGFDKKDYTNNTVYHAPSFFKILDDYIYLRINSEQGMNTLDTTGKENYRETRETRGAVQQYNAKLLLSSFGNYSQTLIQNPVYFNPPIGKLDRIRFTWVDSKGQTIDNTDCEWSAAINITERTDRATIDSVITRGKI